jgi:dolichol-phosphate mannosyltransferase
MGAERDLNVGRVTPFISVVIPVYRSERILDALCAALKENLTKLLRPYEIVLVDDRSPDRSWDVISRLARADEHIMAVRLSRNFGQHYAITAGLDLARGEWVVVMDCDLQDRPEEIANLLAKAEQGHDIVLARRMFRAESAVKRLFSSLFYSTFNLLSGYHIDPSVGSFRILRRPVVEAYRSMREGSRLFGGMIEWLGFESAYVDVEHAPRFEGKSTYNLRALMRLALDGIIAFSNRPLYFSIGIGITMSLLAGALGTGLVINFLIHPRIGVPGWLSLVTLSTFIGGLILLNLGILGIYVGRIYDQTKGRPLYVIDRILTWGETGDMRELEMMKNQAE